MTERLGYQFPGKDKYIKEVFQTIAPIYDRMNIIMTWGLVYKWRRALIAASGLQPGAKVLDVGTGTGELAFMLAKHVGPKGEVHGVDFSPAMLELARGRMARRIEEGQSSTVNFLLGDALALPYPAETFDGVVSAFLLRNVVDLPETLKEMARVCRPGGCVACLDISRPYGLLGWGFDFYFHRFIPWLGRWCGAGQKVRGRSPAYDWLSQSLRNFPQGQDMARVFRSCGLHEVGFQPLSGGLTTIYVGWK